ncbi:hypothetical protein BsWGS_07908 [Bradybaena similaris]
MGVQDAKQVKADTNGHNPSHLLLASGQGPQVLISRAPFTQAAFDELHLKRQDELDHVTTLQKIKQGCFCSKRRIWRLITGYIPLIKFLRYYKFKEFAIIDIFAGLSVGTIHIPQALAFGQLASAKVENGLFSSLWPALIYVFFGTSAHVSMGTSAVICLLTATTVDRESKAWVADKPWILAQASNGTSLDDIPEYLDFKEEIAMGLTLIIGIMLVIFGFLKLGFITFYLSDSFFAAYTSAAAVHIGTTQLPAMLGIKVNRYPGIFKIIFTYKDIFENIMKANFAAIIIALICIALIWFVKEAINEKYKQKLFAPIPIELFIVIFGTVASYCGNFREKFGIGVVGEIPLGIPVPKVPVEGLKYASNYIVDSFVIAILTFAYTIAIAKICAKKHNYEVDDSQEMISYGLCNLGSAFLKCIPSCVAPPRSMVASTMNAKSTINGIFSCALMLLVIMIVAALFRELPKAVLAAIIFIALKNLFIQIKDVWRYFKINKFDFVIWNFTFFSTVFLDIDVGLGIGVGISLICVVFQTQFAKGYKLGYTKKDTTLVEHKYYKDSSEIPGIKIFRFKCNLFYANAEIFRSALYRKTVNPRKLLKGLKKREKRLEKLNEERMAQGLPPQVDNNFIMTGQMEKPDNYISSSDLTAVPKFSILKSVNENVKQTSLSNSDVTNSDSEVDTPNDLTDTAVDKLDGKRVRLSNMEKPVYVVPGSNQQLFDGVNAHTTPGGNSFSLSKRPVSGGLKSLKSSESVVSLYSINFDDYVEDPDDGDEMFTDEKLRHMRKIHHIIIDCSPINYVDTSGTNVLTHIFTEYTHVSIKLYFAGCSASIRKTMRLAGVFDKIPESHFFVDVHDAVSYARPQRPQPIRPENIRDFTEEEAIENSRAVNI